MCRGSRRPSQCLLSRLLLQETEFQMPSLAQAIPWFTAFSPPLCPTCLVYTDEPTPVSYDTDMEGLLGVALQYHKQVMWATEKMKVLGPQ